MSPTTAPWKVNQLAEVETVTDGIIRNYASRIEDFRYGDIGLATPIEQGRYVYFMLGQPVTIYVTVRGLYYFFHSNVTGTSKKPIPIIWVAQPRRAERLERRRYVRVDVDIHPDEFMISTPDDTAWKSVRCKILDISAGGICFTCREAVPQNGLLKTSFELPDKSAHVETEGQVVRLERDLYTHHPIHRAGASFSRLRFREQEAIIKFVLRRQAEMIRKGHM